MALLFKDSMIQCFNKKCEDIMKMIDSFKVENGVLVEYTGTNDNKCGYRAAEKEVVVPDKINDETIIAIGSGAFYYRQDIKTVTLPSTVKKIYPYAFNNCHQLRSINIGSHVSLEKNAIFECRQLAGANRFVIYNDILFDYCGFKTELMIPNTVKRVDNIGKGHDLSYDRLRIIVFPSSVKEIAPEALCFLNGLEEVVLPSFITKIPRELFGECSSLRDVKIGQEVEIIEERAFYKCVSLTNLVLPHSISLIKESAFAYCKSLDKIKVPDDVQEISKGCFRGCTTLREIKLPKNLKKIGQSAFAGCKNLFSVVIPEGTEEIGAKSFHNCPKLRRIYIPNSVKKIHDTAFLKSEECFIIAAKDSYAHKYCTRLKLRFSPKK